MYVTQNQTLIITAYISVTRSLVTQRFVQRLYILIPFKLAFNLKCDCQIAEIIDINNIIFEKIIQSVILMHNILLLHYSITRLYIYSFQMLDVFS